MLMTINWKKLSYLEQLTALQRPILSQDKAFQEKVNALIEKVRWQGDTACRELTLRYDGAHLDKFKVSTQEMFAAEQAVNLKTQKIMQRVIKHLCAFHKPQKLKNFKVKTAPGVVCESIARGIERVGLYIPGGSAPLVSTVFMLGVPAMIAGCALRVLCTPPRSDGSIDPHILVAAEMCGIKQIFKIGGAQAIAAMAYGTETIPKVDKIFGPGNAWVTQAKMQVAQDAAGAMYDLPAGPSEVMVIADNDANPAFVAADLLSQAEHGSDSQVILVCVSNNFAARVNAEIEKQLLSLNRNEIAQASLKNSRMIVVDNIKVAMDIANLYAPEHLILQVDQPRQYLDLLQNAGSVFLGQWSPESAGDYVSGTNHVLPTYGYARNLSGLSVRDFMKTISIQTITKKGLAGIAESITTLANIEGLTAHANAVSLRIKGASNAK